MRYLVLLLFAGLFVPVTSAQNAAEKIYYTERAFEKAVAEKGINAGFVEFMAPDGLLFTPEPVNGREWWTKRPASPASLTWNPIWIEVSSNGVLAYSIGNGIYRPKGKDDTTQNYSHYLSIWSRQLNGKYLAVMDTGINHEKPASRPTDWKSPQVKGTAKLPNSAGDHAVGFYETVESGGAVNAYKKFLADDAFLMREGSSPYFGKKSALDLLGRTKPTIKFAKRKTFVEAGDLAWVYHLYAIVDKTGKETERGNVIQVWKLRGGKWLIAADVFVPLPKAAK